MSTRYKVFDPIGTYFLTLTAVGWIDIFSRKQYKDIIIESLKFCRENKGLEIYAYVIMSNHLHLIASSGKNTSLIDTLASFKKFTARKIIGKIQSVSYESRREWLLYQLQWFAKTNRRNQSHQMWQSDNHPFILFSPKMMEQKIGYIHNNPVRAGLVELQEHYVYSSANYYVNGEGVLDVIVVEPEIDEGYVHYGI